MRLIVVAALSLFFTGVVTGSAYQYVRRCKSHTEPCINLRCTSSGQSVQIPTYSLYSCCANKVFDERNYVCVKSNGVTRAKSCNPCTQFRCGNSQCVLKGWRCDKEKDCKDGSDEVGCGSCWSYQFRCANGRCIHREWVCDKKNNCGDGSDELGCLRKNGGSCGSRYFRCSNDRCIPKSWVCDRYDDCRDNSDERGCIRYGKKRNIIPGLDEEQNDQKKGKAVDAAASTIAS